MSNLRNIFGQPQYVEGLGEVYPVRVKNYEEFAMQANFLKFHKAHFPEELANQFTLFELIATLTLQDEIVKDQFLELLKAVTEQEFEFINEANKSYKFVSKYGELNNENYDAFRDTVMRQNLVYEEKVYKNATVKKWAEKVMAARAKNAVDMTMEDMVSVVKVFGKDSYEEISNYTIYQLEHTFQRIMKVEDYKLTVQRMLAGDDKSKLDPFAEKIDLYKNPYDDLFKDKGKLSKLNQAMNG